MLAGAGGSHSKGHVSPDMLFLFNALVVQHGILSLYNII